MQSNGESAADQDRAGGAPQSGWIQRYLVPTIAIALCLFTLLEANYPMLQVQAAFAVFVMGGLTLCFLVYPAHKRLAKNRTARIIDFLLALGVVFYCGYIFSQTESRLDFLWLDGQSLSGRVSKMTLLDIAIGILGLILVIEGTRRSIGLAVPILAVVFILYALFRESMPEWLLPHRSQSLESVIEKCLLQSDGVFGLATGVMFKYVFLFVVFGAFLEATGATQFIIDLAQSIFGRSPGGPAKVSVLGSGLMGSLSGSAVANAVTTGSFTIPMMRSGGFRRHVAGGITAAAAAGGALVPPVMGAGAYMMLDIGIEGVENFMQIVRAAIIPAVLYYFSIFLIVHYYSKRIGVSAQEGSSGRPPKRLSELLVQFEGIIFFGALSSLIGALAWGFSPTRAVTISLAVILVLGLVHPRKRITLKVIYEALVKSAKNGVSLVAASACVGIVIGIVDLTGVAQSMGAEIKALVAGSLLLALLGIMGVSIFLGMGVPSVVCYLLMATLMGSLLDQLGVIPLAAHFFIFYFGMMSMVTPPVALAAYASASIADAKIMRTAFSSFLFSLVGFTLPFMFVYRPALLMMDDASWDAWMVTKQTVEEARQREVPPSVAEMKELEEAEIEALSKAARAYPAWQNLLIAVVAASVGILSLATAIAGYFQARLGIIARILLFLAAAMLLSPDIDVGTHNVGIYVNLAGGVLFAVIAVINWTLSRRTNPPSSGVDPKPQPA